jgi:hypothetical protein
MSDILRAAGLPGGASMAQHMANVRLEILRARTTGRREGAYMMAAWYIVLHGLLTLFS